jgi:hypothetical protein
MHFLKVIQRSYSELEIKSVLEHKLQREQFDSTLAEKEQSISQTVNKRLFV